MKKTLVMLSLMVFLAGMVPQLAFAVAQAGACNGATCKVNGTTLNCPASGGPTCATDETCVCTCKDLGQHNYTAYNECKKKKKKAGVVSEMEIMEEDAAE